MSAQHMPDGRCLRMRLTLALSAGSMDGELGLCIHFLSLASSSPDIPRYFWEGFGCFKTESLVMVENVSREHSLLQSKMRL